MENQNPNELNKNLLVVCVTVIAVCIIVSGVFLYSKSKYSSPSAGNNPVAVQGNNSTADISKVKIAGLPFVGDPNAKVVIAFWSDYQCPFCKKAEQEVIAQIYNEYVKTGKVKIVYKDYAFLGADSQAAGWAARAVFEVAPDKFYEWSKAMFEKQDDENRGWGKRADILALTQSLGIDSAKVDQLITANVKDYQEAMDADKTEGTSFGVQGTPSMIIGKQLVKGAQPYSTFKAAIDQVISGK